MLISLKFDRESDDTILDYICEKSGFNKNDQSFLEGYNTILSREFDGVDLSGGQWQKVAIARGIYRDNSIIILDEPTAAIDPLEETKIYRKFIELAKEKTSLIVTHRLGSARIADRILVMKDGSIAQIGTHSELIEIDGEYILCTVTKKQKKYKFSSNYTN